MTKPLGPTAQASWQVKVHPHTELITHPRSQPLPAIHRLCYSKPSAHTPDSNFPRLSSSLLTPPKKTLFFSKLKSSNKATWMDLGRHCAKWSKSGEEIKMLSIPPRSPKLLSVVGLGVKRHRTAQPRPRCWAGLPRHGPPPAGAQALALPGWALRSGKKK